MPALQAVLLIGGFGTRLRPMTDRLPKSMVPVLNVPAIEHTIAYLKRFGIRDIILTLNYLPDIIRDRLGDGERYGVNLVYCMEQEPLGTAGAVKNTEAFLNGTTFAVLNGDVFADLDIGAMLDEHRTHKAAATIALHQVEDPSAFGVVEQTGDGRVAAFVEKPKREAARSNWINAGTYLLEPEVLRYAPAGEKYMFENGLFPALLDKGERFYGFRDAGYWLDMGRPETYYQLSADLLAGAYKSPATPVVSGLQCAPGVTIPASTSISGNVIIAGRCHIGERAEIIGPCAIGPECTIGDGTRVTGGILWDGVNIGDGARVEHAILCSGVSIKRGATVKDLVRTVDAERPLEGAR